MRYEEYKRGKYDWLPEIPEHWDQYPLRRILSLSDERKGNATDLQLLSVYREYGVIPKSSRNDNKNHESEDTSKYKVVKASDVVINKMKLWQGSLGVSQYDGFVSPAYIVAHTDFEGNLDYLNLLLRSPLFKTYYNRISYGIRVGQWDSDFYDFKRLIIPVPPREEQDQIVRYLDWKVSCINKLIHGYQRQIKLLEEQYTSMVTDAVVHGINADAHLVDANIQGFDRIPDTWKIIQNKRIFRERSEVSKTGDETLLSVSKRFGVKPYNKLEESERLATIKPSESLVGYKKVAIGNLAMNIMRARNGSYGISNYEGIVSPAYCVYELVMPADSRYIHYLLKTPQVISLFEAYSYGICEHRRRLYAPDFLRLYLPIPPAEEQKEIADYVATEETKKKNMIKQLEKQISLLKEYRTRLISDVVTGQMDVRGVAVPDYTPENDTEEEEEMTDEEVSMDAD